MQSQFSRRFNLLQSNSLQSKFKIKPIAVAIAMASASFVLPVQTVQAQEEVSVLTMDIPAGPLGSALNQLAKLAKVALSYDPALAAGKTTQGIKGSHTLEQALDKLLQGSGVGFNRAGNKVTLVEVDEVATLDTVHVDATADEHFGDAPPEPEGFKAEYQTTATKMAMSLKETPQAISVVTRDSMDARQVQDLSSAVELTAGVSSAASTPSPGPFGGQGQFGQGYVLRGQTIEYYRGIRTDGFVAGTLSAVDLAAYERVEVVKGPSGFYGQGALGGYINLVRKKPKAEFGASITTQLGSYDTYRVEADITGSLTDDGRLRGQLTVLHQDAGAFTHKLKSERTLIAPSLEVHISDNTRVLFQALYQEEEFDANNGVPLNLVGNKLKKFNLPRSFLFGVVGDDRSNTKVIDLSVKIDHELSDRWLATVLLQKNKTERNFIEGNAGYLYGQYVYISGNRHETEYDLWAGELRLEGKFDAFGREHAVLFGVESNQAEFDNHYGYTYNGALPPTTLYADNFSDFGVFSRGEVPAPPFDYSKINAKAVYGQTVLSLHDRTKLLLSARYDWADQKGVFRGDDYGYSKKALTMRIGLAQEITDNISAYAVYGESFQPTSSLGQNGVLEPITGEGYELGLKTDWFNHKLGATVAVYRQELDNRPITDPASLFVNDGTPDTYSMSAGLHRTDGIELEVVGSPLPGLTVAASADWSNNEFRDKDDPNVGLSIDGSIDKQFSLYANYELQGGPLKGFGFGATFVNVGERQYLNNRQQIYLDGYERVDLNFSYKGFPHWDMSLQVRNLLDKTYIERSAGRVADNNHFGSPRAALFKATYHF